MDVMEASPGDVDASRKVVPGTVCVVRVEVRPPESTVVMESVTPVCGHSVSVGGVVYVRVYDELARVKVGDTSMPLMCAETAVRSRAAGEGVRVRMSGSPADGGER